MCFEQPVRVLLVIWQIIYVTIASDLLLLVVYWIVYVTFATDRVL